MEKVEFIVKDSDCSSRQLTTEGHDLSGECFPSYRLEHPRFTEPSVDVIEEERRPNRIEIGDGKISSVGDTCRGTDCEGESHQGGGS